MENKKIYWKGVEELSNQLDYVKNADREFPADLTGNEDVATTNRRDFLKLAGFSVAAVSLAACDTPVKKAIPYLNKPEDIDPTIPNYYASTYLDSNGGFASILVKTREGRPIKIEPNEMAGLMGLTNSRVQASTLILYDNVRLRGPKQGAKNIDWKEADAKIVAELQNAGQIRLVTSSIHSPTTRKAIAAFLEKYPNSQHVQYDAISVSGMLKANEQSFGIAALPTYDFSKANVIVSIGSDFLGTGVCSSQHMNQYVQTRKLHKEKKQMSRHYHFETNLTLTGANADYRTPIRPSQEGLVVAALYNAMAAKAGKQTTGTADLKNIKNIEKAANDLWAARGKAIVISGSNDVAVQTLVNGLNVMLESYGNTLDLAKTCLLKQGDDQKMANLVQEIKDGRVGAVLFYGVNPVYDHAMGKELAASLKNVKTKISFADRVDETASLCDYITPDHHYLESWNDAEPVKGFLSLCQPTISPVFKTRQAQESLLRWSGDNTLFHQYLENNWNENFYKKGEAFTDFAQFWTYTLHDGVLVMGLDEEAGQPEFKGDVATAGNAIAQRYQADIKTMEVSFYEKVSLGNGDQANNPWLQELPDPITKACWDNYATMSLKTAKEMGMELEVENENTVIKVEVNGKSVEVPVLIQPGQAEGTISIALGYGREKAGLTANGVGQNVYPMLSLNGGTLQYAAFNAKITKTGNTRKVAQTQTQQTIMGRPVVQESYLVDYQKDAAAGRHFPKINTPNGDMAPEQITLWKGHDAEFKRNHFWNMVIDLNACTGCGTCVIACQTENNIPVVGRQEVINRREMHWMRIDRYYSSDADPEQRDIDGYHAMEIASANPEVTFQPMLCQHCENAPCETVCPVLATTHSSEGLNQMTYNRCIGTRYCANNCPYKVRRFNWFKYNLNKEFPYYMDNDLGRMVLNPDVTVRARGVIEKCSFCVQRIQYGKLEAKKARRRPIDGEIRTACQQGCPTNAITFGDANDPESAIAKLKEAEKKERNFVVLEDLNIKPVVSYLTKIRNKDTADAIHKHSTQPLKADGKEEHAHS
jgi:MoCo/4Fe-4S cofactor protein with predicted Tat translocation signal